MIVVSDSSPLITLARVGCFHLLPQLFGTVRISDEVFHEVSIIGAGLPGASEVATSAWIEVQTVHDKTGLANAMKLAGLGAGEVSAVLLAKQVSAELVVIDEWKARRFAREQGFAVTGCIGILEDLYERGELSDLRGVYWRLIEQKARVDIRLLTLSLAKFKLPPL